MRLAVLDVGSNTVHLLVVDARRGAHPTPMTSEKTVVRLAERIDAHGRLTPPDEEELARVVARAKQSATDAGCHDLMAFATSAIRDAANAADVLARIRETTGVDLTVLSGAEEARLTFLAARRWFGWSAGRLLLLDIGGGSLELAVGLDEDPELALSLPLGAGRLARTALPGDPPSQREIKRVRAWLDEQLAGTAKQLRDGGRPDRVVATSKTFRSLARLTGAAASSAGPRVRRTLTAAGLRQLLAFITRMSSADLATLDGVSSARAHQLVAGALVAEASMRALSIEEVDLCPWALREGVILRRLDLVDGHVDGDVDEDLDGVVDGAVNRDVDGNLEGDNAAETTTQPRQPDRRTGRDTPHGARWRR